MESSQGGESLRPVATGPDAPETGTLPSGERKNFFALAFGAGAFDAMVQLGVVHALMVARKRPPDVVLGLSAGAVNAVALAEVFTASPDLAGRVARFRAILNAARNSLRVFRYELSPDLLELHANYALAPIVLPHHREDERNERGRALRSAAGVLRLFNDITRLPVTLHVAVQALQRYLAHEEAKSTRIETGFHSAVRRARWELLKLVLRHPMKLLHVLGIVLLRLKPWQRRGHEAQGSDAGREYARPMTYFLRFSETWRQGWQTIGDLAIKAGAGILAPLLVLVAAPVGLCWILRVGKPPAEVNQAPGMFKKTMEGLLSQLLESYDLRDQLFHDYVLKQFLISTFDEKYYGVTAHDAAIEQAVGYERAACSGNADSSEKNTNEKYCGVTAQDAASKPAAGCESATPGVKKVLDKKTIGGYFQKGTEAGGAARTAIRVAIVATSIDNGKPVAFPPETSVIDAVMASMALPPLIGAQEVDEKSYVDPSSVGEEAIAPLMDYLRECMPAETAAAYVFHVVPFPTTTPEVRSDAFGSMSEIGERALELLRTRRVSIEQRLTEQYNDLLPKNGALHRVSGAAKVGYNFVASHLISIEPEQHLHITERFLAASTNEERETVVLQAVATGCRIFLQRILASELRATSDEPEASGCAAILQRLRPPAAPFPGSQGAGPGLYEVCRHCDLRESSDSTGSPRSPMIRRVCAEPSQPIWPYEESSATKAPDQAKPGAIKAVSSTADHRTAREAPWISTVWSGGVFRGVFQIGAIAAYNEAGVKPRVFAGASVGSIMAAMAARVTSLERDAGRRAIQRAAATFIGLDRLVMTDRFADLCRRLAIRANHIHVTPKMVDDICRQFDRLGSDRFNHTMRAVAAGAERLLYISPFELFDLLRAAHNADGPKLLAHLRSAIDYCFERSGAGLEILGAEPLRMLIAEHVLEGMNLGSSPTMQEFLGGLNKASPGQSSSLRKYLLVSTTDLTVGKHLMIGADAFDASSHPSASPLLIEALLAGSAFPAVFRPRRYSEVYPTGGKAGLLVDGGMMDNLPLMPLFDFLKKGVSAGQLVARPNLPHLILTASLERRVSDLKPEQVQDVRKDWRKLSRRVTELRYNRKVVNFASAQRHFQVIHNRYYHHNEPGSATLDLQVAATIPNWLCGTFGFHPMLGFSQVKQAASIAHGCAMTFATLAQLVEGRNGNQWGIAIGKVEEDAFIPVSQIALIREDKVHVPRADWIVNPAYLDKLGCDARKQKIKAGACWFRAAVCPFSQTYLEQTSSSFSPPVREAIGLIHQLCGKTSTHTAQP